MSERGGRPRRFFFQIFWRVVPMVTLVFFLLGLQAAFSIRATEEKEARAWLARQSDYALTLVMHPLRTLAAEAEALAGNDLVVNGLIDTEDRNSYLPAFFRSLRLPGSEDAQIFMLDYRGRIVASNQPEAPAAWTPSGWEPAIARNAAATSLTEAGLTTMAPIRVQASAEGAIVIHYPAQHVGDVFAFTSFPLATAIIDEGSDVIFSSDAAFAQVGRTYRQAPEGWVVTERPIAGLEGKRLVSGSRASEVLDTVYEIGEIVAVILLLSVLALVGTAGFAAYVATREVGRVVGQIQAIGSVHDMNRRIEVGGPRELRELGDSFNAMLDVLQRETTSRDYVDSVLNSLSEILIVVSPSGQIRTTNPAAHRFLREMSLPANGPIGEVFRANSYGRGGYPATFLDWLGGSLTLEATYTRPSSGEPMTILWLKSLLRDQRSGKVAGTVFVGQDISDRIRVERLKSEFISTVSHELRTPLTSIAGTLGLLKGGIGGELPAKALDLVAIGHHNCNRLILLINDLLDIQKIEAGGMEFHMRPIQLGRIVRTAISHMQPFAAEHGVTFASHIEGDEALVEGDADRLEQVMANLLSNAVKFSPKGAAVTVTVRADPMRAFVAVADRGPGIPEEFRDRIFRRFAQADSSDTRRKGGTGLGLAIVQAIVKRHGGRVWYESEPGKGATFFFTLPLHVEPPIEDAESEAT